LAIRTCLFDMGNVLVYFSHEKMCEQMGALCGRSAPEIRERLLDSGLLSDFERGLFSKEEFHRKFEQAVEARIDFDDLRQAGSDIFWLNEPLVPLLDQLKVQGHRLVLLSNTSLWHFEVVRDRFDVLQRFDDYVISCEVGAVKPEAAIFEAALQKIECAPAECFYTDDVAEYIERGRGFGLQADVFVDAQTLAAHLQDRGVFLDLNG